MKFHINVKDLRHDIDKIKDKKETTGDMLIHLVNDSRRDINTMKGLN